MSHVVEHFPEQQVVVDNNGDIRVPDDYLDGDEGNDGYSFKDIPDAPILFEASGNEAELRAKAESYYDEQLEIALQKFPSSDLARADLARREIVDPTEEVTPEPDYTAISKVSAEAIRQATHDEEIAKVKREIFDPDQQEKAIVMINTKYRIQAERRQES